MPATCATTSALLAEEDRGHHIVAVLWVDVGVGAFVTRLPMPSQSLQTWLTHGREPRWMRLFEAFIETFDFGGAAFVNGFSFDLLGGGQFPGLLGEVLGEDDEFFDRLVPC
jgi:hypothetical protein